MLRVNVNIWPEGRRPPQSSLLRGGWKARDLLPGGESFLHLLTVYGGREEVTSRAKVLGDRAIGREEALGVTRGLESLQAPFALAGGLVRVFGAIIEVPVLAVLHAR